MSLVALMPENTSQFCRYTSLKVDVEILLLVRAAAALSDGLRMQDWASDVLNEAASKVLNRRPIKRKPPPPAKKKKPKP